MKIINRHPNYAVLPNGDIVNIKRGKIRSPQIRGNGYHTIAIQGKNYLIHRLIAEAYVPNDGNKPYVNHKNGIKTDNRIENLEWCTGQENRIHAVSTGLITNTTKGRRMHSILDETQVRTIRKCLTDGMHQKTLAGYFKVSQTLMSAIKRRVAWATLL